MSGDRARKARQGKKKKQNKYKTAASEHTENKKRKGINHKSFAVSGVSLIPSHSDQCVVCAFMSHGERQQSDMDVRVRYNYSILM